MQIRNLFLVLLLFVLAVPMATAQLGVRAGINLAGQTYDEDVEGAKRRLGFAFGVNYKIMVTDNFSVQPEINYIQHGAKSSVDFLGTTVESSATLGYLQIPVLAKYGFGNMDGINYYVQAGPYLGLGIGKIKVEACAGGDCDTGEADFGDDSGVENMDFGAHLGAGINITKNISVDARYILGLRDISIDEDASTKNNGIFVSVGYSF